MKQGAYFFVASTERVPNSVVVLSVNVFHSARYLPP